MDRVVVDASECVWSGLLEAVGEVALSCWYAADESGHYQMPEAETGLQAARQFADAFEVTDRTQWINVRVWREARGVDEDGEPVEGRWGEDTYTVTRDPAEPACAGDEHDWRAEHAVLGGLAENPGVWGSGGGVKISRVCAHCGAYQHTDTWATNQADGTQGHTSVSYEAADERSLAWVRASGEGG